MDSKQLMIGDWVHFIDLEDCIDKDIQWTAEDYIEIDADFCNAIPLTKEILKANGFEMKANNHYYIGELFKWSATVALFDDGSVITITNDLDHLGVNKTHICDNGYVHILQHALRLCGLGELADDFKLY